LPLSEGIQVYEQLGLGDGTYLPMRRGFFYLVAIMDWHTREVLAWCISNTLEADFCILPEFIRPFQSHSSSPLLQ